jgi:hypothetical protein
MFLPEYTASHRRSSTVHCVQPVSIAATFREASGRPVPSRSRKARYERRIAFDTGVVRVHLKVSSFW